MNASQKEVWDVVEKINQAWIDGHPESLKDLFHEDVIIRTSEFKIAGQGRDACVQSYVDFVSVARIIDVKITDPEVDAFGATAMAGYRFDIQYELEGKEHRDIGRDIFMLVKKAGQWKAAWRLLMD